jgi:hypothetical protein
MGSVPMPKLKEIKMKHKDFKYKDQQVVYSKEICYGSINVKVGNSMEYGVAYYEYVKLDK